LLFLLAFIAGQVYGEDTITLPTDPRKVTFFEMYRDIISGCWVWVITVGKDEQVACGEEVSKVEEFRIVDAEIVQRNSEHVKMFIRFDKYVS